MDHVDKLLLRIPQKHRRQVADALDCLHDPSCRITLRAEKLSGSASLYRTRVGKYRIFFRIDEQNKAVVKDVRLRNESTYRDI
jgi:mRNA-degrading endonuclease RelE of RelBE toxin-antitoxin system